MPIKASLAEVPFNLKRNKCGSTVQTQTDPEGTPSECEVLPVHRHHTMKMHDSGKVKLNEILSLATV
jgi:hypothetical protein